MKFIFEEISYRENELIEYANNINKFTNEELTEEIILISKDSGDKYTEEIYNYWREDLPKLEHFELVCKAISDKFYVFVEDEDEIEYVKNILKA